MRSPITAKGAVRLRAELEELKSVKRPEVIAAIAEARAHGDLKENAEYHAAREQQGFIEGRIKHLEGEIEAARQQIKKYREQQLQIKSNEGYKALEKEIATAQGTIRNLEDQELAAMETVETARGTVAGRKTALASEQVRVDAEVQTFTERNAGLGDELQRKEDERRQLAAEIDPTWLARYERLFAKQRDAAIALVEHGTCGSCHMKLSPSQVVEARKSDTLTLCDFCGRMLYLAT